MVDHASDGQLPLLEQIGLISAQMIQAKLVRRRVEMAGKLLDQVQVVSDRGVRVVTALEFLQHDLA
jgi:hypothetical protein